MVESESGSKSASEFTSCVTLGELPALSKLLLSSFKVQRQEQNLTESASGTMERLHVKMRVTLHGHLHVC